MNNFHPIFTIENILIVILLLTLWISLWFYNKICKKVKENQIDRNRKIPSPLEVDLEDLKEEPSKKIDLFTHEPIEKEKAEKMLDSLLKGIREGLSKKEPSKEIEITIEPDSFSKETKKIKITARAIPKIKIKPHKFESKKEI